MLGGFLLITMNKRWCVLAVLMCIYHRVSSPMIIFAESGFVTRVRLLAWRLLTNERPALGPGDQWEASVMMTVVSRIRAVQAGGWAGGGLWGRPHSEPASARHAGQCWPRSLGGQEWPSERQRVGHCSVDTSESSQHHQRVVMMWHWGMREMLWRYDTTGWETYYALSCYDRSSLTLRLFSPLDIYRDTKYK